MVLARDRRGRKIALIRGSVERSTGADCMPLTLLALQQGWISVPLKQRVLTPLTAAHSPPGTPQPLGLPGMLYTNFPVT